MDLAGRYEGTHSVLRDLRQHPHLILWAVLAGALWAVANTLTIFAIRDVGLAIAFPLWNTNTLVGIFWGWALFRELRGASAASWAKVLGGAAAIVPGSALLSALSIHSSAGPPGRALNGIAAALGAGLLWGTMYVPYRKAYLTGINPLSFVTIFTFGEMGTMLCLAAALPGGIHSLWLDLHAMRPWIFWLLLGGFCWVIGDLFQQYATKYVGISRAIPLSNTNQLWGFAWGVLVFGEFSHAQGSVRLLALGASGVMIVGAMLIAGASVSAAESASGVRAVQRECSHYGLDLALTLRAQEGLESDSGRREKTPVVGLCHSDRGGRSFRVVCCRRSRFAAGDSDSVCARADRRFWLWCWPAADGCSGRRLVSHESYLELVSRIAQRLWPAA
jgi:drug/metabolite transporter (DMT)-like permease